MVFQRNTTSTNSVRVLFWNRTRLHDAYLRGGQPTVAMLNLEIGNILNAMNQNNFSCYGRLWFFYCRYCPLPWMYSKAHSWGGDSFLGLFACGECCVFAVQKSTIRRWSLPLNPFGDYFWVYYHHLCLWKELFPIVRHPLVRADLQMILIQCCILDESPLG